MPNHRIAEISDEFFQGFQKKIDLDQIDSKEEIVDAIVGDLKKLLKDSNLHVLLTRLDATNFHIHGGEFGAILMSEPGEIIWVCNHC